MTSRFADMTFFLSLVKLSYWFKFYVNIITGSGVMTIFFYKGLTKNPEIGNTFAWVLPNIWRVDELGIRNLARLFLMKCYWMLQNARVTAFTVSELLRLNQQWVEGRGNRNIPKWLAFICMFVRCFGQRLSVKIRSIRLEVVYKKASLNFVKFLE